MSEDIDALLARVQTRLNDGGQIFRRETVAPLVAALVEARERAEKAYEEANARYIERNNWREIVEQQTARAESAEREAARLREAQFISIEQQQPPEGVDVEFIQLHRGTRHGKQWVDNEQECAYRGITHWRPLPQPPAGEEETE